MCTTPAVETGAFDISFIVVVGGGGALELNLGSGGPCRRRVMERLRDAPLFVRKRSRCSSYSVITASVTEPLSPRSGPGIQPLFFPRVLGV